MKTEKTRKNATINHATSLYYKFYDSLSKKIDPDIQDIDLKWLNKPYDFEVLRKDVNDVGKKIKATVDKKTITIDFISDFMEGISDGKITKDN